jgi:hypothetical protein
MAKGIPTDRSRRYKANQEKKSSSPTTTGNDVFPSPPISPITQAEVAERAFSLARVLLQSLLHTATPGTNPHDLLINLAPVLSDCSEWYRESEARNNALTHYRNQFLEYRTDLDAQLTSFQQTDSQLQEMCAKYDKLSAQSSKEDSMLKPLIDKVFSDAPYYRCVTIRIDVLETFIEPLFKCSLYLQPRHYKQYY